jgi:hypothetical protein
MPVSRSCPVTGRAASHGKARLGQCRTLAQSVVRQRVSTGVVQDFARTLLFKSVWTTKTAKRCERHERRLPPLQSLSHISWSLCLVVQMPGLRMAIRLADDVLGQHPVPHTVSTLGGRRRPRGQASLPLPPGHGPGGFRGRGTTLVKRTGSPFRRTAGPGLATV